MWSGAERRVLADDDGFGIGAGAADFCGERSIWVVAGGSVSRAGEPRGQIIGEFDRVRDIGDGGAALEGDIQIICAAIGLNADQRRILHFPVL